MPATRTGSALKATREHRTQGRRLPARHNIVPAQAGGWVHAGHTSAKSVRDAAGVETGGKGSGTITGDRQAHHVFGTSVPAHIVAGNPDRFVDLYRQRRVIETGYRCYQEMRPGTTSRHESVRIPLMFFPFLIGVVHGP